MTSFAIHSWAILLAFENISRSLLDLINRYGFNSSGTEAVLSNVKNYRTIQQQSYNNVYTNSLLPWYNRIYYLIPSM